MKERNQAVVIDSTSLVAALTATAGLLVIVHLVLLIVRLTTGHDHLFGLIGLFDLDEESNIPSFFSGCLFLLDALLFALVARASRDVRRQAWVVLAALFVFLAYDELFSVHELLIEPLRAALHTGGVLRYPWFLAYAGPVVLLAGWFFPVWRRLARSARIDLARALTIYLLGAVGMEMVGGAYGKHRDLTWGLLVTLEESLEMAGLLLCARALFVLLGTEEGTAVVVFQSSPARTGRGGVAPQDP